jgi:hydroxyacylglutathione hydrolase
MTNCYIFGDEKSKQVALIDTGGETNAIIQRIDSSGLKPQCIILTHGHPDHHGSAPDIANHFKIPVLYCEKDHDLIRFPNPKFIKEPDVIGVGKEQLCVLDSPGHTSGGIMLVSYENKIVFTGDTLFEGSIGRTDFGGNYEDLMNSIRQKLMNNPKITDEFAILPGHMDESTIGNERRYNMFKDDFL